MPKKLSITIVGAGLTGLSCAYYLEQIGFEPLLIERENHVGGRVQTDFHEGFLLDRGFQTVLNNYPEFKTLFSYDKLQLAPIPSGANIYFDNRCIQFDNPLKSFKPWQWTTLSFMQRSDLTAFAKGLWMAVYKQDVAQSTETFLRECGFSDSFINAFWRPFFGGVFLELGLQTRVQIFIKLAKFFATGFACLPKFGIGAIPENLRQRLKKTTVLTNISVQSIENQKVILNNGQTLNTDHLVLATSGFDTSKLIPTIKTLNYRSVTTVYFSFPVTVKSFSPYLHLNGTGEGPINNLLFNHLIQQSYSPSNQGLASISVIDEFWQKHPDLVDQVKEQLSQWFQLPLKTWHHLKTDTITHALPNQSDPPPFNENLPNFIPNCIHLGGELVCDPSINDALYSGRQLAQKIARQVSLNHLKFDEAG